MRLVVVAKTTRALRSTTRPKSTVFIGQHKNRRWLATIAGSAADQKEGQVCVRALRSDRAAGGSCNMCGRSDGGDPPAAGNAPDKFHELRCDHDLNGTTRARDSQRATGRQAWGAQSGDEEPAYIRHIGDNAERDAVAAPAKFAAAHWGSCNRPWVSKRSTRCELRAASCERRSASCVRMASGQRRITTSASLGQCPQYRSTIAPPHLTHNT